MKSQKLLILSLVLSSITSLCSAHQIHVVVNNRMNQSSWGTNDNVTLCDVAIGVKVINQHTGQMILENDLFVDAGITQQATLNIGTRTNLHHAFLSFNLIYRSIGPEHDHLAEIPILSVNNITPNHTYILDLTGVTCENNQLVRPQGRVEMISNNDNAPPLAPAAPHPPYINVNENSHEVSMEGIEVIENH